MAIQRVRRVIRKVDPWTVLKVSLIFNALMALAFVLGTVIFWAIFGGTSQYGRNTRYCMVACRTGVSWRSEADPTTARSCTAGSFSPR